MNTLLREFNLDISEIHRREYNRLKENTRALSIVKISAKDILTKWQEVIKTTDAINTIFPNSLELSDSGDWIIKHTLSEEECTFSQLKDALIYINTFLIIARKKIK